MSGAGFYAVGCPRGNAGIIDYSNLGTHRRTPSLLHDRCVGKRHAREHAREDASSIMALMQAAIRSLPPKSHAGTVRRMTTENKPRFY